MICKTLQEFLAGSKVTDDDLIAFTDAHSYTNQSEIQKMAEEVDLYLGSNGMGFSESHMNAESVMLDSIGSKTYNAYSYEVDKGGFASSPQNYRIFFRGVSDQAYKLAPGIYRVNEKEENFYFHELHVRCPNILSNLKYFNKLTYMQHYGSPTRLLDITANPLVGLYFACEKDYEKDGVVFMFYVKSDEVAYESSDRVQMLSHLQELNQEDQYHLQMLSYKNLFNGKFPKNKNSKYSDSKLEHFYYNVQKENNAFGRNIVPLDMLRPVFVQANQDNPRILKQDGAFIMSALDWGEMDSDIKIRKHVIKKITIPSECKKDILSELETICIHKASLFPELDTVSQYLKKK